MLLKQIPPYRNPRDVRHRLKTLKSTMRSVELDPIYESIYNDNTASGRSDRIHAVRVYRLLLECRITLKVVDLVEAISLRSDGTVDQDVKPDYVLDITKNFVFVERRTQFVSFADLSVVEFLSRSKLDDYSWEARVQELARTSLSFLSYPGDTIENDSAADALPHL
jgi:hypothetical protein